MVYRSSHAVYTNTLKRFELRQRRPQTEREVQQGVNLLFFWLCTQVHSQKATKPLWSHQVGLQKFFRMQHLHGHPKKKSPDFVKSTHPRSSKIEMSNVPCLFEGWWNFNPLRQELPEHPKKSKVSIKERVVVMFQNVSCRNCSNPKARLRTSSAVKWS